MVIMNTLNIVFYVVVGLGFVIMLIIRKYDKEIDFSIPLKIEVDTSGVDLNEILSKFGKRVAGKIPDIHLPLNQNFIDLARVYEKIGFEGDDFCFDRTLMEQPYSLNPEYVLIASFEEWYHVLIKRQSEDASVYINHMAEGHENMPDEYYASIEDYIISMYDNYLYGLKQEEKRKKKIELNIQW